MKLQVNVFQNMPNQVKSRDKNCTIDRFGDHGGFFDKVVRPMLQQGHEGELCLWLREMSLLRTFTNCPQEDCNGRNLTWRPARIIDKYKWTCPCCKKVQPIRDHSFFMSIKCDLKMCLQIILAWCQAIPSDITANDLGIKEHVVKKVYERCGKVVEAYVTRHSEEWILGGPGSIIIVDEFPGGYMSENSLDNMNCRKRNNNSHTILCIAEANLTTIHPAVPPRMWLHVIEANPVPSKIDRNDTTKSKCGMVEEALSEIIQHVLPGSYVVANGRARCCNYESVKELKQYAVLSVEYLQKFDSTNRNKFATTLETIWQTGIDVCEEVQDATRSFGQNILATYLWRQRFAISPFQSILTHIVEYYRFT